MAEKLGSDQLTLHQSTQVWALPEMGMSTDVLRDLKCGFGNTLIEHLYLGIA